MDGILLINKPKGLSSFRVIDRLKKRFQLKKIGHSGTLDPEATGLLIALLGKYTKKAQGFIGLDKEYKAVLRLGAITDTQDATGKVTLESAVRSFSEEEIKNTAARFIGAIRQIPPMYSAKSINGKRLYKLARAGITVKREPVTVKIYDIIIDQINLPDVTLTIYCSSGTYIRTLCQDFGIALGCGAHLLELCRTKIGKFKLSDAVTLNKLSSLSKEELITYLSN